MDDDLLIGVLVTMSVHDRATAQSREQDDQGTKPQDNKDGGWSVELRDGSGAEQFRV